MSSDELKAAGMKVTTPRLKILKLLQNASKRHMGADDIYKLLSEHGEKIGLPTIYRVLMQFAEAGLVKRHFFENGRAVFELEPDEHHDHMVCAKTGKVVEFYDEAIEQRQKEIAAKYGFTIYDHTLVLYGVFEE